jgi:sugar phosphate isomerase/epimerase
MVFGYSTNAFTLYTLSGALETIAELGFSGAEIMCDRPHLYPPDYDADAVAAVKKQLDSSGLRVTNLNSFTLFAVGDTYLPSWIEAEAERRLVRIQHTQQCLQIARALGCGNISIPPGGPSGGGSREDSIRLFREGLDAVLPLAEEMGVKLLVEPEPELLIERTAEFEAFIRDVRSPWIGLNFDVGHFFCAGEDPAEALETLFEWVGHIHLEDIGRSRIHHHLVPGDGAIDFASVFRALKRLGYTGDITLELYPYANTPEIAGRKSLAHIRPLFGDAGIEIA